MNRLDVIEQVVTCTNCELASKCTGPVPMRGQPARIAIVGEAPGETEDREGQPFVGPSGKLLTALLTEVGVTEEAGVLNTVSCWPRGTPTWDHVVACRPNVEAQLDYLDPQYVLLLGRVALAGVRPDVTLKRGRGRPIRKGGRLYWATYHPAAALRNSSIEDCMKGDLERFRELLDAGDQWMDLIPSYCSACPNPAEWWEADSALGWCPIHLPASEQAGYQARQALIAADSDALRRAAVQARDSGMAQVTEAADADWMVQAWDALIDWLRTHDEFFSDDFWEGTQLPRPRESRALGPLVMKAAKEGLMAKSGEFRKSVASNMSEKPVWKSLLRSTP